METEYTMSEDLQEHLQRFFSGHNITLLKENLRRLLVDFLDYELRTGVPVYFDNFLYPFNSLLDVLDAAGKEADAFEQKHTTQTKQAVTIKDKVLSFIKASLSPEKIFLLHETTTADSTAYFDLLVVIPDTSKMGFNYYEQVISMANIDGAELHVSLHKSVVLRKQLTEGHIYFSLHCMPAHLVYDDGKVALPEPDTAVLQSLITTATDVFNTAYTKAESFLQGATNYMHDGNRPIAAFMLQQCVELCLRGLITALLGGCPKTHCFRDLKLQLKRCAPELLNLFSADAATEERLLRLLEKAYLDGRYSDTLVVSDDDMKLLKDGAEKLLGRVKEVFEGRVEG